jgi:hypothetical protein
MKEVKANSIVLPQGLVHAKVSTIPNSTIYALTVFPTGTDPIRLDDRQMVKIELNIPR